MTALGAKAIRMGDVTGTISVGKRADRIGFAMLGSLADRVLNFGSLADMVAVA